MNLQLKTEIPKPMAWPKLDIDPDKSTLVYIHIPKTAGSTFRHMLGAVTKQIDLRRIDYSKIYSDKSSNKMFNFKNKTKSNQKNKNPHLEWYPDSNTNTWNSLGCREGATFGGTHCGYSEIKSCMDDHKATLDYSKLDTIKYFSVIRDPVERVISEYFWWKNKPPGKPPGAWTQSLKHASKNFTAWILHADNSAHNRQFKSFVDFSDIGYPTSHDADCLNVKGDWFVEYWHGKWGWMHEGMSDSALTRNVFENIQRNFGFIGVLEEMKDSLDVFELLLSGEDEVMVKKSPRNGKHDTGKNRKTHSSNKGEVTVFQRRLIWERNQLDLALYKFVRGQLNLTKNK